MRLIIAHCLAYQNKQVDVAAIRNKIASSVDNFVLVKHSLGLLVASAILGWR
jgi:hypothetical protein